MRIVTDILYLAPLRRYRSLLFKFWTLWGLRFRATVWGLTDNGTYGRLRFGFHHLTMCALQICVLYCIVLYDVHLGLIGKRVVDFLLVIMELFSLGITAEALRTKID